MRARNAVLRGGGRRAAGGGPRLCGPPGCGPFALSLGQGTGDGLAAVPNAAAAMKEQWRSGHYEQREPSPESVGFRAAGAARTRSCAPRWMPARAPIRGGRRCSPAWGDCAEPMASLAASARLHRGRMPRRPGGAPELSSCHPRPSRRLVRPPPRSRQGNSEGSERRKGRGADRAHRGAAQPRRGAAGPGPASGTARHPARLPRGRGGAQARGEAGNLARGQAPACRHPWPGR